jgi:hypothetical protein
MAWLNRNRLWVLVLDGTERWTAFPRLAVFPSPEGWGACVIEAPGKRTWVPGPFANEHEAKRAAVDAARRALPERWQAALGPSGDAPAANEADPARFALLAKLGFSSSS